MMNLDQIVTECRKPFTLRFRAGLWFIYRGTDMMQAFLTGAEALKALREIQHAELLP